MNLSNQGETITKSFLEQTQNETDERGIVIVFGRLMCNLGQYDKSQKYFQQLLNHPNGEDLPWIQFNIGRILRRQRKYNEAFDYHQQALKMREKYYTSDHNDIARSFNNIGKVLDDLERYDEALDYYRRALKMREKYFSSSHIYVAHTLSDIGTSYQHMNNTSLALEYYNRALTIYAKFLPDGSPDRAQTEEKIQITMKKSKTHSMITFF